MDYIKNFDGTILFHYERSINVDDEVILKDKDGNNIQKVETNFAQTKYAVPPLDGGIFLYVKKIPFSVYFIGAKHRFVTENYIRILPQENDISVYIKD